MKLSTTGKWQFFGVDIAKSFQFFVESLVEGVPIHLKNAFTRQRPILLACVHRDQVTFVIEEGSESHPIGNWSINQLPSPDTFGIAIDKYLSGKSEKIELVLQVDEQDLLVHRLQLPLQIEPSLRQSVAYQLSRHTPFTEEQVFFDAMVVERDKANRQIQVELVIAPKVRLLPIIENIERITGFEIVRISTAQFKGAMNLLGTRTNTLRPNKNVFLLLLLLGALMVAAISPLMHKRTAVVETKAMVLDLRKEASGIMDKKLQLEKNIKVLEFLVNKRKEMPKRALIVEELSRIIPDEIYLSSLKIKGNMATLQGQGKGVVTIIEKLEASPLFVEAKFTSTVNRNARTGLDRFSIKLDIQPEVL